MRNLAFLSLAIIVLGISSCDKVDNPYQSKTTGAKPTIPPTRVTSTSPTATDDNMRKILIEDYLGHLCANCPTASSQIDVLLNTDAHKSQGILVAINASILADSNSLVAGAPFGAFKNLFTTTAGTAWYTQFNNTAVPGTMVNRVYCANPPIQGGDQDLYLNGIPMNIPFDSLAMIAPAASIHIVDSMYAPPTNTLSMTISAKIVSPQAGNKYYLQAVLVEDSLYDWQDSMSYYHQYYLHRMFMRDAVNGINGDSLANDSSVQAKHYVYTSSKFVNNNSPINPYALAVPVTSWNMAHMFIVVFLYQTTSAAKGDYLILQAQRLHL